MHRQAMERRHNTRHAAALLAAAAVSTGTEEEEEEEEEGDEEEDEEGSSSGGSFAARSSPAAPLFRNDMHEAYQAWAMRTYGDSAKTKTVTRRKYGRIFKILRGEEQTSAENSKFRFWVKAKGFRVGPPRSPPAATTSDADADLLYVPCSKITGGSGGVSSSSKDESSFKKVAVVENFFEIIYGVHVEMDGRGGKHAGQKRTYKAIAETYAFLPREAVTHFLMSCADCQKRMHLSGSEPSSTTSNHNNNGGGAAGKGSRVPSNGSSSPLSEQELSVPPPPNAHQQLTDIDYSLPITTTYLKHMRRLGYSEEDALNPDREDSCSVAGSELSEEGAACSQDGHSPDCQTDDGAEDYTPGSGTYGAGRSGTASPSLGGGRGVVGAPNEVPLDMSSAQVTPENGTPCPPDAWHQQTQTALQRTAAAEEMQPLNMTNSHKRLVKQETPYVECRMPSPYGVGSSSTRDGAPATPDNMSAGTKDEDDDDDEDDQDRIDPNHCDPERLKAFNMFVRLFVDENLDRMVPISKQPKEKIQAIIDSCARQFPEFSDRGRKRIRTYLKSCRRNKRTRDQCGWDAAANASVNVSAKHAGHAVTGTASRPTPPHLTSALAEQILANACDNESQNAKRMRLGLKPISVALDEVESKGCTASTPDVEILPSVATSSSTSRATPAVVKGNAAAGGGRQLPTSHPTSTVAATAFGRIVPTVASMTTANGHRAHPVVLTNGPTDLTVKRSPSSSNVTSTPGVGSVGNGGKYSLNASEMTAVRQLIAGYRESAAFLLRSADELEQLLLQQN